MATYFRGTDGLIDEIKRMVATERTKTEIGKTQKERLLAAGRVQMGNQIIALLATSQVAAPAAYDALMNAINEHAAR
jgi:hypothetical protein